MTRLFLGTSYLKHFRLVVHTFWLKTYTLHSTKLEIFVFLELVCERRGSVEHDTRPWLKADLTGGEAACSSTLDNIAIVMIIVAVLNVIVFILCFTRHGSETGPNELGRLKVHLTPQEPIHLRHVSANA